MNLVSFKKNTIFFLIFLCFSALHGQQHFRSNIWYFGKNAGIDFNLDGNGVPEPIRGELDHFEGTASISDEMGNLLFYSDGITVYDRNGDMMPEGTGLGGDYSAAQMLIVPHPGDPNLYYIFTADAHEDDDIVEHEFTLVDTSLNDGLGDVLQKNEPLTDASGNMAEAICGVACPNGISWIITHRWNSNKFLAYKIDKNGLHNTPVESEVGPALTERRNGKMKFSHDGTKIVTTDIKIGDPTEIMLCDFDPVSGKVRNPEIISLPLYISSSIEFSPDNTKLYVANADLIQIDLVNNNAQFSFPRDYHRVGRLALGPNGKIYCTSNTREALHVINEPNRVGIRANFVINGFQLLPGTSTRSSLPDFMANLTIPECTVSEVYNNNDQLPYLLTMVSDFIWAGSSYDGGNASLMVASGSANTTTLQAENYVELGPDFEAKPSANTYFLALISPCYSSACNGGAGKRSMEEESTEEEDEFADLYLFPNPLYGSELQLEYTLAEDQPVSIFLYNAVGQEVRRLLDGVRPGAGSYSHSFNVSDLASGIYTCRMQAGEKVINRKLIVQ